MNTFSIMNYIENLRIARKITQEEFLHDVISPRQYQRYRNGVSIVPIEVLELMAKRLGVEFRKLLDNYESGKQHERNLVIEYYNSIARFDYVTSSKIYDNFSNHRFLVDENKSIFSLAKFLEEFYKSNIQVEELFIEVCKIINYPHILGLDILRDVEVFGLSTIYQNFPNQREKVIVKFRQLVNDPNLILTSQIFFIYIRIIYFLSKYYGSNNEYYKVIENCNLAIDILEKKQSRYNLHYFYYHLALAYYNLNNLDDFQYYLFKSILILKVIDSDSLTMNMGKKFVEHFNIDLNDFFYEHSRLY